MTDQTSIIEGASCEHCGGPLVASDGHISCFYCSAVAGLVTLADRVTAHHNAISADINVNTRRRPPGKRRTKAQQALDRLNNATLFDPIVHPQSNNRNGLRPSRRNLPPPSVKPLRVRLGRTRCIPCDRLLVVRANKVICPACGVIMADLSIVNLLRDELGAVPVD